MMDPKPLRGALVGAGRISAYHLHAWQRIPLAEIVAIADIELGNAQARAREFNIDVNRAYATLAELLQAEKNLDFVDLVTPVDARVELVKLTAKYGLHINCQKPFARTLVEAQEMIEVCQAANVVLNVNENWRWRSWYRHIKQMVTAGEIGRVVYCRVFSHSLAKWARSASSTDPHRQRKLGILLGWGIHHVDVTRFLFGEPTHVYARMAKTPADLKAENRMMVTLTFGDLTALIDISSSSYAPWAHPDRKTHNVEDVRIEGEKGTILLIPDPDKGDLIRLVTDDEEWERPAYDGEPIEAYQRSYVATQGHFIECLVKGTTPETNALDNYETLAITLAAYHSAEQNQVVDISDFKNMN